GEEALQPSLSAGTSDLTLADVPDVGIGDARRSDPIIGADIDRADQSRDLDTFIAAVESEQLLALHQHRAIRIDFGYRHADLASKLVRLRGFALPLELVAATHADVAGREKREGACARRGETKAAPALRTSRIAFRCNGALDELDGDNVADPPGAAARGERDIAPLEDRPVRRRRRRWSWRGRCEDVLGDLVLGACTMRRGGEREDQRARESASHFSSSRQWPGSSSN